MDFLTTNIKANLLPHNGEAYLYTNLCKPAESERWINALLNEIQWQQSEIKMFGKTLKIPRLNAWYGDEGKMYSYSGIMLSPLPWTQELMEIKERVEVISGVSFNSVLINLYRNGQDSMGWHRDNEKELGMNPVIGSFSLGATRTFRLRNIEDKKQIIKIPLTDGSFLLMKGSTQHYWEHDIPKEKKIIDPRINLTFRVIV